MEKQAIFTGSRVAGSPYSPGIVAGNLVFVSGQIPMNPENSEVIRGDIEAATKQCLENVERVLRAAGAEMTNVVKCVVFLTDMNNFTAMNSIYKNYFGDVKPARSCVQVSRLPMDVEVEIEAIAVLS